MALDRMSQYGARQMLPIMVTSPMIVYICAVSRLPDGTNRHASRGDATPTALRMVESVTHATNRHNTTLYGWDT